MSFLDPNTTAKQIIDSTSTIISIRTDLATYHAVLHTSLANSDPAENPRFLPALAAFHQACVDQFVDQPGRVLDLGQFSRRDGSVRAFCTTFFAHVAQAEEADRLVRAGRYLQVTDTGSSRNRSRSRSNSGGSSRQPTVTFADDSAARQAEWLCHAVDLVGCYATDPARENVYEPAQLLHPILWLFCWQAGNRVAGFNRLPPGRGGQQLDYDQLDRDACGSFEGRVRDMLVLHEEDIPDGRNLSRMSRVSAELVAIVQMVEWSKGRMRVKRGEVPVSVEQSREVLLRLVRQLFGIEM